MDNRSFRNTLMASLAFAVSACQPDVVGVTTERPEVPHAVESRFGSAAAIRTVREEFRDLAKEIPGFTGIFRSESGQVVISATRSLSESDQRKVLGWARAHQYLSGIAAATGVTVVRTPYDYASLYEAFISLRNAIGKSGVLTSARIDETTGHVVFGVYPTSDIPALATRAQSLGIPDNMVQWVREEPVSVLTSLSDYVRPIVAGLEIHGPADITGICTLGPLGWRYIDPGSGNVDYSTLYGMTASHCTSNRYVMQGDTFGQPDPGYPIGVEVEKAPVYSGGTCPYASCQDADVAVIRMNADIDPAYGQQAAKSSKVSGPPAPYLGFQRMSYSVYGVSTGELVTKVGRTSGQTSGKVTQMCVDSNSTQFPSIYTLCSTKASVVSLPGDSGSPVFIRYNEPGQIYTPRFGGVLWGGTGTVTYFSPYSQITGFQGNWYKW